jgi:hypothetical protein
MKELEFDGSEVKDGRLPPGSWDLEIVGVKEATSQAGNLCLDVHFKEVNDEGRQFERIPWMAETFWRIKRLLAAADLDPEGKHTMADLKQDLIGAVVRAEIIEGEMPNGDKRMQIKSFSPVK